MKFQTKNLKSIIFSTTLICSIHANSLEINDFIGDKIVFYDAEFNEIFIVDEDKLALSDVAVVGIKDDLVKVKYKSKTLFIDRTNLSLSGVVTNTFKCSDMTLAQRNDAKSGTSIGLNSECK